MRSLRSYLLLPRPGDAVKWWIMPSAFAVGAVAGGGVSAHQLARAAVVWFALELLVYQARYQWNDIRGFEADREHPDAAERGRLPGPLSRGPAHKRASALVAAGRLAATVWIGLMISPLDLAAALPALIAAVFGLAIVYEAVRSAATGGSDAMPPPLRPAIVGLWVVAGGGYAIRGVTGLALAVDLTGRPALAAAATVAMWAFGVSFVTGRWAVESLSFARLGAGGINWTASARQAREHSLALVRWLPRLPNGAQRPSSASAWTPLHERTSLTAPWNIAVLIAAGSAGIAGRLLAGAATSAELVPAAAGGALLALGVITARTGRVRRLAAGAALLCVCHLALGSPRPALAVAPVAALLAAHLFFASQSLEALGRSAAGGLAGSLAAVRSFLGADPRGMESR